MGCAGSVCDGRGGDRSCPDHLGQVRDCDSLIPQSQFVQPEWPWQAAVGIAMTL